MSAWAEIRAMSSSDPNNYESLCDSSSSSSPSTSSSSSSSSFSSSTSMRAATGAAEGDTSATCDSSRDTLHQYHASKLSRFTDDDNYMLKSSTAATAATATLGCPASSSGAQASVPYDAEGEAAALTCCCLPSCCCNCLLISSISECKALLNYVTRAPNENASTEHGLGTCGEGHNSGAILICVDGLADGIPQDSGKIQRDLCERRSAACSPSCEQSHLVFSTFLRQGLTCHDCGRAAYRTCSATGLPSCLPAASRDHLVSSVPKTVFGVGLCSLFDPRDQPAPAVVARLTQEIEAQARLGSSSLDLYQLYGSRCQPEAIHDLRTRINEDAAEAELSLYDTQTLVWTLKRFLRQLPDPVIPVHWYERLIQTARNIKEDPILAIHLLQLVDQLPDHHRNTLRFLMAHFCRISQIQFQRGRTELPQNLIQNLSQLLMRPPWERITQSVHNSAIQMRIMKLLFLRYDWGETLPHFANPPQPPPRFQWLPCPDSLEHADSNQLLEEAEWFWDSISRDKANELLKDAPDGSFLIRNASSSVASGDYTLTLRKGGAIKLIKIKSSNGRYGFSEPLPFRSVCELVAFYRGVSLAQYHPLLDVKLLHPVSRYQQRSDGGHGHGHDEADKVFSKLQQLQLEWQKRVQLYDRFYEDLFQTLEDLHLKKQVLEALSESATIFEEDLHVLEKNPGNRLLLVENRELLKFRLAVVNDSRSLVEESIRQQSAYSRSLDREMNALKPELNHIHEVKEQHYTRLVRLGICRDKLSRLFLEDGSLAASGTSKNSEYPVPVTDSHSSLSNPSLWLLPDCKREEAERLLRNQSDGTFLVRCSSNPDAPYALSIVCHRTIGHCLIYRSDRGYGFADPCFFPSLKDLVVYHATATLEDYNSRLTTTLKYPVLAVTQPKHNPANF